jgi:tetratricopeptide (TPR) repeat protein
MERSQLGQLLAKGGEGEIFSTSDPSLVAKIYHQGKMTPDVEQKLRAMLANPPEDSLQSQGRVSIAWIVDLVIGNGSVQGYVMPRLEKAQAEHLQDPYLNLSKCRDLIDFYNPSTRRKHFPWFHYRYLLRTARNIAIAIDSFHAKGYVIGDVNESNILVALDTIVTFVDTDSFQVPDRGKIHRCQVGKPEYTPPELQGTTFKDIDRTQAHDLFGLGVIIFQLLMQGQHPFAGVYQGQGEVPEIKDRIEAGHFPHGKQKVPYTPVPLAPPFNILPLRLQRLFIQCFEVGHYTPLSRPTAEQWKEALTEAEGEMNVCSINEHHFHAKHLKHCPWCELSHKLGGRDPFPSQVEIQGSGTIKMPPSLAHPIQRQPNNNQISIASQSVNSPIPIFYNLTLKVKFLSNKKWISICFGGGVFAIAILSSFFIIPASYINQGLAKYKLGDIHGSLADYNQAINLNPFLANAYNNRGYSKYKLGDVQGAMEDYNQAIKLNPDLASSYNGRGLIKYKIGDLHGSIAEYDQAIFLEPSYFMSYINRASAKYKLGERSNAISDYDKSLSLSQTGIDRSLVDYDRDKSLDPIFSSAYI